MISNLWMCAKGGDLPWRRILNLSKDQAIGNLTCFSKLPDFGKLFWSSRVGSAVCHWIKISSISLPLMICGCVFSSLCLYVSFSVCLFVFASVCLCVCVSVRSAVGQCVSVRLVAAHLPENTVASPPISPLPTSVNLISPPHLCSLDWESLPQKFTDHWITA